MDYNFIWREEYEAFHFGCNNNGIGVFEDPHDGRATEETRWFANIVFFDHDIWGIGPFATMEEAKAEAITYWEGRVKEYGADYGIVMSDYLGFGLELEDLLRRHTILNVYGALKMAVKNMKAGKSARWLILGDHDKYRDGFMEFEIPCKELRKILVRYKVVDEDGRMIK
jgi:hypothetical protein